MALEHVETDDDLNISSVHGVLVGVFGKGVLIVGRSGIGKSACALELIDRGHVLVADDVVVVNRVGNAVLGKAPPAFFGLIETRGLGIVNARQIFGNAAVSEIHEIDLCIEFTNIDDHSHCDRLGLHPPSLSLLGIDIPRVVFTVSSAQNLRVLVETAVRHILGNGEAAVREFSRRYDESLMAAS